MTTAERIIPALDFDKMSEVEQCLSQLPNAKIVKIDYAWKFIPDHPNIDFFVDEKYFDIPQTVSRKIRRLTEFQNVKMCTVHAEKSVMAAAVKAAKGSDLKILAVPLLTSMAGAELTTFFNYHWEGCAPDFVLERVKWAVKAGCHGTICSAQEVALIRNDEDVPDEFLIIVPGTRSDKVSLHDHKRSGSPRRAIEDGASHIVVGRQIINDPDPAEAFGRLVVEIS